MSVLDTVKGFFKSFLKPKKDEIVPSKTVSVVPDEIAVYAPCAGLLLAQKDIPDEGFSEGHMGQGFGIDPSDGHFKAFMDGELIVVYKTKHAYFMKDIGSGVSVMLHIGINTVEIDESKNAFVTDRTAGEKLVHTDDLCVANLAVIAEEGKSTVTALLVQNENMEDRKIVYHKKPGQKVEAGDLLMTIVDA